jgi:dCMP deaminase
MNAILQCAKLGISCDGAKIYITTHPCIHCLKAIINAGIKEVIYIDDYNDPISKQLVEESGIKIKQYKGEDKNGS